MISDVIKQMIEKKFGKPIRYSKDCESLAITISSESSEPVSATTIKRMFGFVNATVEPRDFTLDVIAKYLGENSWKELIGSINNTNFSELFAIDEINVDELNNGEIIEFAYKPDRVLTLEYEGNFIFQIKKSQNSKLKEGDKANITHFVVGYPLIISQLWRKGKPLGQYIAGKTSGITHLKKVIDSL
jgi:hypothetical protein